MALMCDARTGLTLDMVSGRSLSLLPFPIPLPSFSFVVLICSSARPSALRARPLFQSSFDAWMTFSSQISHNHSKGHSTCIALSSLFMASLWREEEETAARRLACGGGEATALAD
jgi:hypothetical protein